MAERRAGGRQIVPRPDAWSPGPQAPWELDAAPTLDDVLAAVPEHEHPMLPAFEGARHSAVLIALADGPQGPEVLLTRRSWEMRTHRGEVSFPGGRLDPGETAVEAALREAHEEVGLDPTRVSVHGELEHLNTVVSRSYIVPKVATVPERLRLRAETMEVDRVMWVPLCEFTRPDTYRSEVWGTGATDRLLHFFELDDETVWGATAHMLVDLLRRTLVGA
jgi:8-oxo-dGTP pyrophosphatase MutT (NUDIX family)